MTKAESQARAYAMESLEGYHPMVRDFILGEGIFSHGEEVKMHMRVAAKIAEHAAATFREQFAKEFSDHKANAVVEVPIPQKKNPMPHAWSSNPDRDAKVRMEEDGRTKPYKTLEESIRDAKAVIALSPFFESCWDRLETAQKPQLAAPVAESETTPQTPNSVGVAEAISRAGQFTPPEAAQPPNCTERESGLRTERVTLECVHSFEKHPSLWDWWRLMELRPGESVRVVDAAKLAPAANAEVGSNHASPVASVVPSVIRDMTDIIRGNADPDEKHAALATLIEAVCPGWRLAPAASVAAGTGWLTEEERKWIEYMESNCVLPYAGMKCMEAILARSSPPEVVLPVSTIGRGERYDGDWVEGWIACRERCAAALAAAGVRVKEVGK